MLKHILLLAVALSIPCFASHQCPDGKTNGAWCAQPQPVPPQFPNPIPKPPSLKANQPIYEACVWDCHHRGCPCPDAPETQSEAADFVGAPQAIPVYLMHTQRPFGSSKYDGALGNPLQISKVTLNGGVDWDCYWECIIGFGPGFTVPALLYCKAGCTL